MLFDDSVRTDTSIKLNRESDYAFLNRSGRPGIEEVRQFLEALIADYPQTEIAEMLARIRSGDDRHFKSATFELMLYATLTKLGYSLEPHPLLENGVANRPDFLVTAPDGNQFYLEAVLASENNGADPAADARIGTTLDFLSQSNHQNFMVAIESEGLPITQPSGRQLRNTVSIWLDTLDPDASQQIIDANGFEAGPSLQWSHEDWRLTFRAIPLKPERRGKATTLVGVLDGGAAFIDSWTPIRNAVRYKGARYGDLGMPLLIAVNFDSMALDPIDEVQALYGQEQFVFNTADPSQEPRMSRARNGAWYGNKGPQAVRVSGVWIFDNLSMYTIARRRQSIYFNPWAAHVLPCVVTHLPHVHAVDGRLHRYAGLSLREVFDLAEGWPE